MLGFLANNIEQLDLALEHVLEGDTNNARFGLMLTDNVVEITLHQIAKDRKRELGAALQLMENSQHSAALKKALGQHFESKIKFAKLIGAVSEEVCGSLVILHSFRNEVYHIGVHHEAVLPTLSVFYFKIACGVLKDYKPRGLSWGSGQTVPGRAKKYFSGDTWFPGTVDQYRSACATMSERAGDVESTVVQVLAAHLSHIVDAQDIYIDVVSKGGPRKQSRDVSIIEAQAWPIAFSEEGQRFAAEHGCPDGNALQLVKWITDNYPFEFRRDPIAAWRERVNSVKQERSPHAALRKYRAFMHQTSDIREKITEAARQTEVYIEEQIERMRER